MFERPLPNLLSFTTLGEDEVVDDVAQQHAAALSAAAIDTLVSCCPQLQDLAFSLGQPSREALTPLLRLSALTDLVVTGVTDAAVLGAPLYHLTGLRRLAVWADDPQACSEATLLQLTALRQLTHLRFPCTPAGGLIDEEVDEEDDCVELWVSGWLQGSARQWSLVTARLGVAGGVHRELGWQCPLPDTPPLQTVSPMRCCGCRPSGTDHLTSGPSCCSAA